jgi:hypothetical protein
MPSREEYQAKAQDCLRRAFEATDKETVRLLRALAADYFDLAERTTGPVAQQRQQMQPKKPEPDV